MHYKCHDKDRDKKCHQLTRKTQPVGLSHLIGINGWSYEAEPVKMAAPSLSLSLSGLGLDVALAETLTDGCFWVSRWHKAFIFHFCEFLEEMTVSRGGRPSWSTHWSLKNNCHFAPDTTSALFWPRSIGSREIFLCDSSRRPTCDNCKMEKVSVPSTLTRHH